MFDYIFDFDLMKSEFNNLRQSFDISEDAKKKIFYDQIKKKNFFLKVKNQKESTYLNLRIINYRLAQFDPHIKMIFFPHEGIMKIEKNSIFYTNGYLLNLNTLEIERSDKTEIKPETKLLCFFDNLKLILDEMHHDIAICYIDCETVTYISSINPYSSWIGKYRIDYKKKNNLESWNLTGNVEIIINESYSNIQSNLCQSNSIEIVVDELDLILKKIKEFELKIFSGMLTFFTSWEFETNALNCSKLLNIEL